MKTGCYKNTYLTRNYGKKLEEDGRFGNEVIVSPTKEGLFMIKPEDLQRWRLANKIENNEMVISKNKRQN